MYLTNNMENSDVLTIISNLQDSDARNYFETNERLFLLNISEKIKKNPTSDLYHYLLGDVYLEMRRPAMAIASFEEVIRLNPKNGKAHYQLAKAFDQINDTSKAKRHLAKASQIFEDNLDLHWKTKIDAFLLQLRQHK